MSEIKHTCQNCAACYVERYDAFMAAWRAAKKAAEALLDPLASARINAIHDFICQNGTEAERQRWFDFWDTYSPETRGKPAKE